jgi:poly(A) polymerase Pap1
MKEQNLYESADEFQHRVDVLQLLLELVPKWVQSVAKHLGMSEAEIAEAHGAVFSYGSFRLSTHGPGTLHSFVTSNLLRADARIVWLCGGWYPNHNCACR